MITDFYKALQAHIEQEYPGIWIDLWNDQLNHMSEEDPFPFPAVFIEFEPIPWERLSGAKRGKLTMRVHFVQESYNGSHNKSKNQLNALNILENAEDFDTFLDGYSTPFCTPLSGISTEFDHNHNSIIDTIQVYECTINKPIGKRKMVPVNPGLKLTGNIEA